MYCETCKYWETDVNVHKKDWGICMLGGTTGGKIVVNSLCYAKDGESYSAWLETYKTFGCVQYKE